MASKKKKPKKKKHRTVRRQAERDAAKLVRDRERLALLEAGGSAERPLDVPSAAVVEVRAEGLECVHCEGALRTETHQAQEIEGRLLRRLRLACADCGAEREVWVRIVGSALN